MAAAEAIEGFGLERTGDHPTPSIYRQSREYGKQILACPRALKPHSMARRPRDLAISFVEELTSQSRDAMEAGCMS